MTSIILSIYEYIHCTSGRSGIPEEDFWKIKKKKKKINA